MLTIICECGQWLPLTNFQGQELKNGKKVVCSKCEREYKLFLSKEI